MTSIELAIQILFDAINKKSPKETLAALNTFEAGMKNPDTGAKFVEWITTPQNISDLQTALVSNLDIPPRLLAIRRKPMTRNQRAMILFKTLENAISRVYPTEV
jgi:hypothetical protein